MQALTLKGGYFIPEKVFETQSNGATEENPGIICLNNPLSKTYFFTNTASHVIL
jgi:hypothetical protein